LAFLAIQNMEKIWNKITFQWKSILSELLITFGDRIQIQNWKFDLTQFSEDSQNKRR
jgi:hypothetical protein